MKILAFETSSSACSVALLNDAQNLDHIEALHKNAPQQQGHLVLSMIQELLQNAELTFTELDALAFGCGPGSFTGIRIASSVAQGIGFAAGLPIIQISSLAAMAQTAYDQFQWPTLLTALDAHMKQVYFATYEVNPYGLVELIGEEQLIDWDNPKGNVKIACDKVENVAGIGNGWEHYAASLINGLGFQPQTIDPFILPTAKAILKLAKEKYLRRDWVGAAHVMPSYLGVAV